MRFHAIRHHAELLQGRQLRPGVPVDCIRPGEDADGTEMLYIDPGTCIDCGA
jgi:hypothetical protein